MQIRYSLIPLSSQSSRFLLRYELCESYDAKLNESFFFFIISWLFPLSISHRRLILHLTT